MEIAAYVEEAAESLNLPKELREVVRIISYDPGDEEWYSTSHEFQESVIPVEVSSWALRLIGWLQFAYPEGPAFSEASCC